MILQFPTIVAVNGRLSCVRVTFCSSYVLRVTIDRTSNIGTGEEKG